jgi:hypothetical protein
MIEDAHTKPQIGDYVIVKSTHYIGEIKNFLNNNIGQVFSILKQKDTDKYEIAFNVPTELRGEFILSNINANNIKYTRWFKPEDIIFFSKNIKDIDQYILNKKYNL